jgi:hypothetical protein
MMRIVSMAPRPINNVGQAGNASAISTQQQWI